MAQSTTQILFPQTPFNNISTVTGNKLPAAAYYKGNSDLQTLTWNFQNLTGRVIVQASLVENPTGTDWFTVHTINADSLTQISYTNLPGNFVWLRAQINMFSRGVIQNMKVTY